VVRRLVLRPARGAGGCVRGGSGRRARLGAAGSQAEAGGGRHGVAAPGRARRSPRRRSRPPHHGPPRGGEAEPRRATPCRRRGRRSWRDRPPTPNALRGPLKVPG
jgi:hypothetical protein